MARVVSAPWGSDQAERSLPGGWQHPSGTWSADGGPVGEKRSKSGFEEPRFDIVVSPGGYAWWYCDAISADGAFGITIIAFIGSVFSPYYGWSGRTAPENHCALNVALYGRKHARWAMTEHGRNTVFRDKHILQIGANNIEWRNDQIFINVEDVCSPFPARLSGRITVRPTWLNRESFEIDAAGNHRWRPMAPRAQVDVNFNRPGLSWSGAGYLDHNNGDEPLEDAFRFWDWSRFHLADDDVAILYNTTMRNGVKRKLAARFSDNGDVKEFDSPPIATLPQTPVWRIDRRTRCDASGEARLIRTLEDTPFYSRSIIESSILGERVEGMHETLNGPRLRSPFIRALLPFRMPRIA